MNKRNLKKLLFIGLLIGTAVTAGIIWLYIVEKKEENMSFSDFMKYCEEGKIKEVHIYNNHLKAAIEVQTVGELNRKVLKFYNVKFHANYTEFIEKIRLKTIVIFQNTKSNSIWMNFLNFLIQILMLILIGSFLKRSINADLEESEQLEPDNSKTPLLYEVVGFGSIKEEVIKILKYWTRIINDPNYNQDFLLTLLFKGEPGTGKTFLANVMAKSLNAKFLKIDLSSIGSPFIHQTSKNIQSIFDRARELAKDNHCVIIFMDEIDSVMPPRDGGGYGWSSKENTEVVTTVLKNISGLRSESEKKIMVIAATNHDFLDEAFKSRVSASFDFYPPGFKDRYELINFYIKNEFKNVDFPEDLEVIINLTQGKSQRSLKTLLLNSSVLAQHRCKDIKEKAKVTIDDLFESLINTNKSQEYWVSDNEKMSIAMHESGHALIGYFLYYHNFFHLTVNAIGMTIGKSRNTGGVTFFGNPSCSEFNEEESYMLLKNNRIFSVSHCILALGGKIGEMYYFGLNNKKPDSVVGWGGDMEAIMDNITYMYLFGIDSLEIRKIIKDIIKTIPMKTVTVLLNNPIKSHYLFLNSEPNDKITVEEKNHEDTQLIVNTHDDEQLDHLLKQCSSRDLLNLAIDNKEIPLINFNFNNIFKEKFHRKKQLADNDKKAFFVENLRLFWLTGNLIAGRKIDTFVDLSNHCKDRLITCDSKFFSIMNEFVQK
jgi:ATP-dependent Zn protease